MVARDASDLYISADAPPTLKIDSRLHALSVPPLPLDEVELLIYSMLTDEQQRHFKHNQSLDFAFSYANVGRFRINIYRQKGAPAMVARYIKHQIPSISELGLPTALHELVMKKRGLILIVGAPGSGKSTTMASMIDHRNQHGEGHILTIEDPIEFIHLHKKCLVSQREVGIDTPSYAEGLRFGLHETPDLVMIGELRDYMAAQQAIRYTEAGHLCLTSLRARNTTQALERLLNFYPTKLQHRVRQDLAMHLVAIVGLRPARDRNDKRVTATEILINNPRIAELIEQGKTNRIKGAMESRGNPFCQTFEEDLFELIRSKRISRLEGLSRADSCIRLAARFNLDETLKAMGTPLGNNAANGEKINGNNRTDEELDRDYTHLANSAATTIIRERRPEIF